MPAAATWAAAEPALEPERVAARVQVVGAEVAAQAVKRSSVFMFSDEC
jgi:hypothetical protein